MFLNQYYDTLVQKTIFVPIMEYANNILETIGTTPLVKLNKLTSELPCIV